MRNRLIVGLLAMAGAAVVGVAAAAVTNAPAPHDAYGHTASWSGAVTSWHFDNQAPNRLILVHRGAGTAGETDDTRVVTTHDSAGNALTTHSSPWEVVDASKFLPRNAKVVELSFKALITKGTNNGSATVYVFVRRLGSHCCLGPSESPTTPVDFQIASGEQVESVAVASAQLPSDTAREWSTFEIPVVGGKFEWAWGYRRVEGEWPNGDAVGFEMYLNGYGV